MAIKTYWSLVTLPTLNEQNGVGTVTATASGQSREYREFSAEPRALFMLDVSAASGTTKTLNVTIEAQDPGSEKWRTIATFPQQTDVTPATPLDAIAVDPLYHQCLRAKWVVAGTGSPSFTFTIGALTSAEEPAA